MSGIDSLPKLSRIWGLLPYVATWAGVVLLDRGLVAVGVYHAGILVAWYRVRFPLEKVFGGMHGWMLAGMGLLCLLTWPLLEILWPVMKQPGVDLEALLLRWGLTEWRIWVFAVYSVTLHPVLEETFWRGMLPDHWTSDALFAGFHLLVLFPLVQAVWLPVVFFALFAAAAIWRAQVRRTGGLLVPVLTHAMADLGILLAVRGLLSFS
jgi:membrane protease YdiL (CAAX protease family)